MRSKKPFSAAKSIFAILITLLLASTVVSAQTQATKFTVLHTFRGAPDDGEAPLGVLTRDSAGNFYGTTTQGGTGKCNGGCGTAFKLDRTGKLIWLHSFNGKNGRYPYAGLFRDDAGNLYGTTVEGGDMTCFSLGCGTVFELNGTGKETLLYSFTGDPDGFFPEALLVRDAVGNLYGTTYLGGASGGYGTVFKVNTKSKETVLHSFAGPPDGGGDGAVPYAGVIRDAAGNLYGVTDAGGAYCCGTVYEIESATGKETLLYSFTGSSDGSGPSSVLIADEKRNLYGTTKDGGNGECGGSGCGVVFELSPQSDGSWTETTLYTFCSLSNCADGEEPIAGPLVRDAAGNLYGTTFFGGNEGNGIVFKLDKSGKETVLHGFTGGKDGANPWAGLSIDSAGNLYGVAEVGGDTSCYAPHGCGVVFKITP
jgi:uncharacterized repeat protein (TIGR03803 family)